MLLHEVCRIYGLTKKAVRYYAAQGLIAPETAENGYRQFTQEDVQRLRKIAMLRSLGLGVGEIRHALADASALKAALRRREAEAACEQEKQSLLRELVSGGDWEAIGAKADALRRRQSILTGLRERFPGGYGDFFCMHFACFLGDSVQTPEQQEAFDTIVRWLDGVEMTIPKELLPALEDMTNAASPEMMRRSEENLRAAIRDPQGYLREHRDVLEQYRRVMALPEVQALPSVRLQQLMRRFQAESGYNDVFIPAMKRLSPGYRAYHDALLQANEQFIRAMQQKED